MGKQGFEKFINKEVKGAKKKEALKQQKRKAKAELRQRGEEERQRNFEKYRVVTKDNKTVSDKKTKAKFAPEKGIGKKYPAKTTTDKKEPFEKGKKTFSKTKTAEPRNAKTAFENKESGIMPLNKYLAHSGICGRREAATLVRDGHVKVNGKVVDEPGFKVDADKDNVTYKDKKVFLQNNLVYILLNKPKDHLTTTTDPQGRRTVYDIIKNATEERVYPVGRLDRNTTGVLLLTNDGELAQKLTHPKFGIRKIYEVKLDKPFTKKDAEAAVNGINLEDGFIQVDSIGYADPKDKSLVGIEIHSGKNRIVRRIFEHLGYDVKNLDRVMFANLTKKNVERGHYRFLGEREVRLLKYMNNSFVRKTQQRDEE